MIKGIGVDIIEIERVKKAIQRHPQFQVRVFTSSEQDYCLSKANPFLHFAVRFAAKEAILKAIGTGFRGVEWTDLEICRDKLGKPFVKFFGGAAKKLKEYEIGDVLISLSFCHHSAIASAVAIKLEE
ncbi:holo-ACP synthase [Candidatus Oleimmundimicrobium sp.]|uniref:holo-ACP synthase n=1 Tax=Candidatus Oleimmundimicrobium sp. TaxID=3060597 RepID=UPI002717453A|nr:holo-ACP synthase [Candidatus Oleimmundimicrobium sp.]MDO8886023.1 holo-ACP synthase [Candidatus Oleimmundimicrobium sp.]